VSFVPKSVIYSGRRFARVNVARKSHGPDQRNVDSVLQLWRAWSNEGRKEHGVVCFASTLFELTVVMIFHPHGPCVSRNGMACSGPQRKGSTRPESTSSYGARIRRQCDSCSSNETDTEEEEEAQSDAATPLDDAGSTTAGAPPPVRCSLRAQISCLS
jgi:hypothetical protein